MKLKVLAVCLVVLALLGIAVISNPTAADDKKTEAKQKEREKRKPQRPRKLTIDLDDPKATSLWTAEWEVECDNGSSTIEQGPSMPTPQQAIDAAEEQTRYLVEQCEEEGSMVTIDALYGEPTEVPGSMPSAKIQLRLLLKKTLLFSGSPNPTMCVRTCRGRKANGLVSSSIRVGDYPQLLLDATWLQLRETANTEHDGIVPGTIRTVVLRSANYYRAYQDVRCVRASKMERYLLQAEAIAEDETTALLRATEAAQRLMEVMSFAGFSVSLDGTPTKFKRRRTPNGGITPTMVAFVECESMGGWRTSASFHAVQKATALQKAEARAKVLAMEMGDTLKPDSCKETLPIDLLKAAKSAGK